MNVFSYLSDVIREELEGLCDAGTLPAGLDLSSVSVEPPREAGHGDAACNAALVLARQAGRKPRDIAERLAERMEGRAEIRAAEVAGPGFLNLRLTDDFWWARLAELLETGAGYGATDLGRGQPVNVEYVSANPTGPLHVGHARGAVVGDALANLLSHMGFAVTREYYVNDAGAQVDTLARSVHARYREACGETIGAIPEGLYPGDYLIPVGEALAARDGGRWLDEPEAVWLPEVRRFATCAMMDLVRADLEALGVRHDLFRSERELVGEGRVDDAYAALEAADLIYSGVLEPPKGKRDEDWEPREQSLFRATAFGDDTDRPLRKSDGTWTYFATDIAYHRDKIERGFTDLIDVWGADHGGYVKRMKAAVSAVSSDSASLDVKICQMVKLLDGGEPVAMSKRAGRFVTLRDVVDEVGRDVVRFIMLTRRNDAPLEFDLRRVTEQSRDNPVFYVQYAHARACSALRRGAEVVPELDLTPAALAAADLACLDHAAELDLIRRLCQWPRVLAGAATAHEPHRIAFHLQELAAAFHLLWTRGKDDPRLRIVDGARPAETRARLALITAVKIVIAEGLALFGVEPVQEMR
ncbi:MAG: arginine--tRNA ligase [Rhodospirillales bacterium]|nr:arginine--tRNA ligase [Rhodospirillales bacterium]MDE0381878.1 arginine--tRNA ligase [Rhodospirillales bacterium]